MSGDEDPYVYPDTITLRNRLGLIDPSDLDRIERLYVADRTTQPIPRGAFDLAHLRAIHRHLFQDIYDWAGELRIVEIRKADQQFQFRQLQYLKQLAAQAGHRLDLTQIRGDRWI